MRPAFFHGNLFLSSGPSCYFTFFFGPKRCSPPLLEKNSSLFIPPSTPGKCAFQRSSFASRFWELPWCSRSSSKVRARRSRVRRERRRGEKRPAAAARKKNITRDELEGRARKNSFFFFELALVPLCSSLSLPLSCSLLQFLLSLALEQFLISVKRVGGLRWRDQKKRKRKS